jgi:hypothetical protein
VRTINSLEFFENQEPWVLLILRHENRGSEILKIFKKNWNLSFIDFSIFENQEPEFLKNSKNHRTLVLSSCLFPYPWI